MDFSRRNDIENWGHLESFSHALPRVRFVKDNRIRLGHRGVFSQYTFYDSRHKIFGESRDSGESLSNSSEGSSLGGVWIFGRPSRQKCVNRNEPGIFPGIVFFGEEEIFAEKGKLWLSATQVFRYRTRGKDTGKIAETSWPLNIPPAKEIIFHVSPISREFF